MDLKKMLGILFVILGLIFIIYPMYSAGAISLIAGISLIVFGIASIFDGFSFLSMVTHFSAIKILLGICAILLGILFIYRIDALSFVVAFQFYLIAFLLIFFGILGIIAGPDTTARLTSILILIVGIIAGYLAFYSLAEPKYAAILVGVCLIFEGISLFTTKIIES